MGFYLPKAVAPEELTYEQLKTIFLQHDADNDGCLSLKELAKAFKLLGDSFPNWRARRCLSYVDSNSDGVIDLREIEKLVQYAAKFKYK
ncbi:hypothetical protein FNV43_RR11849 [Rhamnella rubrinervis]|uniref:EF-hand domain-containing protein n=1 Tax=Rhamnella rubrinervis TaxID=2594499 RepID=A0A8K0H6Z3_9ROSA|nr:hypothetical protein FNV43_RR11849 [Rhamnella rubrinervis]